jgi:hypothetical protein
MTVTTAYTENLTVPSYAPSRNIFAVHLSTWTRVDSFNYVYQAVKGNTFGPCPRNSLARYFGTKHCGLAGWLPGYPWVIRVLHVGRMDPFAVGLLVAWLSFAVALFLVWFGWLRGVRPTRALAVLVLFGVFPGAVYDFGIFPLSLALALIVASALAAARGRFFVACVTIVAAGLCYPSAWFAAGGLALAMVCEGLHDGWRVAARRLLWGLAGFSSLLFLGFYDYLTVNHFDAYFVLQATNAPGLPGQRFLQFVVHRNAVEQLQLGRFGGNMLAVQAVVATLLGAVAGALGVVALRRSRHAWAIAYPVASGLAVIVGLVAVTNAGAWNRSVALAAPCAICFRRGPVPVLVAAILVSGVTTAVVSHSFFTFYGPG